MSKEISHGNLVYDFKGPTPSINFGKYGGPIYIYGHMKNGEKTLQQEKEEQKKKNWKDLREITWENPNHKSEKQSYMIKNVRTLLTWDKKLLIYLMIMQKLDLKPFTNQNKIKQKEQVLKY